jgi:hypothetical protein
VNFLEPDPPFLTGEDGSIAGVLEVSVARLFFGGFVHHDQLLAVAEGMCKIVRFCEREVAKTEFVAQKATVWAHFEGFSVMARRFSRDAERTSASPAALSHSEQKFLKKFDQDVDF